ncbi:uncharacterized protein LOC110713162 [Chenopodium quinoa]|uniref:uncharacterized protein LOC110713162 n=1 Tax=Chenopodium quinoa TaxID=63459 RepID=UPI000B772AE0|nr:uncharacterized protein LOC110713162 [Chenopodium quinoa]XP_021747323.1 uncharacterized protein LOC110713162 [Chenopodium quinoa]
MFGRRFLPCDLSPYDSEIDRTLRKLRALNKSNSIDLGCNKEIIMANEIKLSEFFTPGTYNSPVGNRMPNVEGNFEIKPQIIQMLPTFYGLEYENPYKHIDAFLEVCSTFSISDAAADAIRMRLFNFSLKEKAKEWLNNRNVTTWAQLQKDFLKKFYSIGKLSDMRRAITTFSQKPNELFYEAWERFCSLLRECPHHEVPKWQLIHSFYYGLSEHNQQMVDASCGGNFMQKNSDEAWQLFEDLSENSQQHATSSHTNASNASRTLGGKGGIYEVSHTHDLAYKVDALTKKMDQVDILNKKIDQLVNTNNLHVNSINANEGCATCGDFNHLSYNCPNNYSEVSQEHVNAAQGYPPHNNPYSNTYNPGWRNHPNFSWKQQSGEAQQGQRLTHIGQSGMNNSSGFQAQTYASQPSQPASSNPDLEKIISSLGAVTTSVQNIENKMHVVDSHTQSIAKLETQIGQLANAIGKRDDGKLPSTSIANPKGLNHEQTQAIMTLRNGKELFNKISNKKGDNDNGESINAESEIAKNKEKSPSPKNDESVITIPYEPRIPYLQALDAPSLYGKNKQKEDILEIFKQVQINLPLLDAIKQIPAYAKFLKDMCTYKRKSKAHCSKKVVLSEQVSSILQFDKTPKFKDPGVPTISCHIGDCKVEKALLDLGSSVNLIPYSVYEQLGLGELQPSNCTLQLADRSVRVPRGRIDDVLIKIDKGFFPVDFVVLDMEPGNPSKNIPVILGRPFLATANATINCRSGEMDVSVLNMRIKLNIFKASTHPTIENESECFLVELIDELVEESLPALISKDALETSISHENLKHMDLGDVLEESISIIDEAPLLETSSWVAKHEPLPPLSESPPVPSLISPPQLELKALPSTLKYAFLGPNETLPVIISSQLSNEQELKLIKVLSDHKKAIGWSVADLKGISPSICMHRIFLEENAKPTREMQRRLNPHMKEVFMKVVKLLDAGIIYPISDSQWVSPV